MGDRKELAGLLLGSLRGQYIIGQALDVAIRVMREEEYPKDSNIQDMELLRDELFPLAMMTRLAQEERDKA